jgi:diguanylate cyclase (GGDEF)-like protein
VVSAGAFVAQSPAATGSDLAGWLQSVRARDRYPELLGIGVITVVDDSGLPDFERRQHQDPLSLLGPTKPLTIIPPGPRPSYCLLQASVAFGAELPAIPPGLDYCAGTFVLGQLPSQIRDSGNASYVAASLGGSTQLIVQTPIYRDGAVPDNVSERRSLYVGNLGIVLSPAAVFASVLDSYPGFHVDLVYDVGDAAPVKFSSAPLTGHLDSTVITLGNGWAATVDRATPNHGMFASSAAREVLAAGAFASVMLAIVVYSLGTGRARARRLVRLRTEELRHQALHDSLTGLPNRTLLIDRVEQLLARCRRQGSTAAALFVDLDNFKNVNDTFGHEVGDQLLELVAARMTSALRVADTIGRMGGDEFVVLIDTTSGRSPDVVAQRLLDALTEPFDLHVAERGYRLTIGASIGIAVGDRASAGDLLRDADLALFQAKSSGRNCFRFFEAEMQTSIRHRVELEMDLRTALAEEQFELHYQPIYNLNDLSVIGAEALLRWNHPVHGIIAPTSFIPILEQTGQIIEVGRWVLINACQQLAQWRQDGAALGVAINISARQLDHASIVHHVREALDNAGLEASMLTLEVTETALMRDPVAIAERLGEIKRLGVRLAVDDFGTGYCSLAYLQQFPVDSLKIDRAFTHGLHKSAEADALIRTLVRLGNDLGLTTLAEGVETIEQLDHLRDESVRHVQGYLLAKPLPSKVFAETILRPATGRHDEPSAHS